MSNPIIVEKFEKILVIRFNRPERRNPLSIPVLEELGHILDELSSGTGAVIFTGTDDAFASGADLREIAEVTGKNAKKFALRGQHLLGRIAGLSQTTIAAINGYCFGGALDLALACNRRIASPNATFSHPGVSLGIITGWGGTQRLPHLVGQTNSLEMFFTTEPVTAGRALRMGLIDKIALDPLAESLANVQDGHSS